MIGWSFHRTCGGLTRPLGGLSVVKVGRLFGRPLTETLQEVRRDDM